MRSGARGNGQRRGLVYESRVTQQPLATGTTIVGGKYATLREIGVSGNDVNGPFRADSTKAALAHIEAGVVEAKEMWNFILAEADDDNEWIVV